MPSKQQLDKAAWQWCDQVEPENISQAHVETAYRINFQFCKPGTCRRNCRSNPNCLSGLGERSWMQDIADEAWHEIDDPTSERRQKGAFVGLKNLGATCYMNSLLQVWYHNPAFRKAIYLWKRTDDPQEKGSPKERSNENDCSGLSYCPNSAIGHLQLIFALLQFSRRRYIDPTTFINCLGLNASQQQDAQEFSKLFISLVEDKLSFQSNQKVRNIVQDQYCGEYVYVTKCHECQTESLRPSKFYELELNIKGHKDLLQCLDEFLQEEKLEGSNMYHCGHCQAKRNAARYIRLKKLPPVLNMQLLRFVFDRNAGCKKKLNSFIRFPEVLDVSKYINESEKSVVYDLCAVLIHRGPSAYSGHYVAHIKDRTSGFWYKFNDETVEKMEGKKLQLGSEESLTEEASKGLGKSVRVTKGYHASNNAYMLVYKCRDGDKKNDDYPSDDSVEWDIPDYLQETIAEDNSKFEDWVSELTVMREQNVMTGKARQNEIRALYEKLPKVEGESFDWISTDWLIKWLTSESRDVPPVDNSGVYCPHMMLNPDKVVKMKCVSSHAAEEILEKYKGGPRIQNGLCRKCIELRCKYIKMKSRIQEDQKLISTCLKFKPSGDDGLFWIGKASFQNWKKWVLKQFEGAFYTCEPSEEGDSEEQGSQENCEEMPSAVTPEEEAEGDFCLGFNEEIQCYHKQLYVDENTRRLVPGKIWKCLKSYFPSAPEFPQSAEPCSLCLKQKAEDKEVRDKNKSLAADQKTLLPDLYLDKNRPTWEKVPTGTILFAVTRTFVDSWRKFIKSPLHKMPPEGIVNASLFCEHGGLLFPPEETGPETKFVLVWSVEWEHLLKMYSVDKEIFMQKDDNENSVDFPVIHSNPGMCEQCYVQRLHEMEQHLSDYTNAKIYVRRVSEVEASKHVLDDHDQNRTTVAVATPPEALEGEEGQADQDPEFIQTRKKKKKNPPELMPLQSTQVRRSNRRRRLRGEKEVTVSSTNSLLDLKLQIMKAFTVAPFDQHLTLSGKPLTDNKATLASLGIVPGSVVFLKVDEPSEEILSYEDLAKVNVPEIGFKGTGLLRS